MCEFPLHLYVISFEVQCTSLTKYTVVNESTVLLSYSHMRLYSLLTIRVSIYNYSTI